MTTDKCPMCGALMRIRSYNLTGVRKLRQWHVLLRCTSCHHGTFRKATFDEEMFARNLSKSTGKFKELIVTEDANADQA